MNRKGAMYFEEQESAIPEFKSYREEAEWGDTHSLADYLEALEAVELELDKSLRGAHVQTRIKD